ncbi:GNAT family N-acetyltransferase [Paraburkholderia sp.]|jgi:hypothetical protein|uniref:GNAT family N-acetyltransferase n=1 Tax=Paraburkholderia sp. TaxID=1926495 RepID=UPI002F3F658C
MGDERIVSRHARPSRQPQSDTIDEGKGVPAGSTKSQLASGLTERSIFHEPWWLEIATNGAWRMAEVKHGNTVVGEMPHTFTRKALWQISTLPPLTRTLGPVIKPHQSGAGEREWSQRVGIARELIAQLPGYAHFHQIMDPRVSEAEALAFRLEGFNVKVAFTLISDSSADEATAFAALRGTARTAVRRAQECLTVAPIDSVNAFLDFYNANLAVRRLDNRYEKTTMGRLLDEAMIRKACTLLGAFDAKGTLVAATALLWDTQRAHYFLSTRRQDAHSGAVSLLIWSAMRMAAQRQVSLDFDGVSTAGILKFLGGFGGRLVRRFELERTTPVYAALRTTLHGARAITAAVSPPQWRGEAREQQRI